MDANPAFSLLLLYRNDPIYSLCASDLMTASQKVNNSFLKDQKELAKTLRRLEQQKLNRLRQLNEEKKQFAFIMRKRLSPRGIGSSSMSKISIPTYLPKSISSREASTTTARSTVLTSGNFGSYGCHLPDSPTPFQEQQADQEGPVARTTSRRCVCQCGHRSKWFTRSESFLPIMQQHVARAGPSQEFNRYLGGEKKSTKN